ncbi:hypothetical protein IWQ61_000598 [Dispira simplex]|nr:hypothetical protein IWQ61_000598 [Dispira simplex]
MLHPLVLQLLASSGLQAITRSGQGVGLHSTRRFHPGDSILYSEPLAYFTHGSPNTPCHFCYQSDVPLHPCPSCRNVAYCSTTCRTQAEQSGHGSICKALQQAGLGQGQLTTRLTMNSCQELFTREAVMLWLVLQRLEEVWPHVAKALEDHSVGLKGSTEELVTQDYISDILVKNVCPLDSISLAVVTFMSLWSQLEDMTVTEQNSLRQTTTLCLKYCSEFTLLRNAGFIKWALALHRSSQPDTLTSENFSDRFPLECLARFRCNNFTLHDEQLFAVGDGTYPLASLLNHSCAPNAVVMYERGGKLKVRALTEILPGQQILIAYVDGVTPFSERQRTLNNKYQFRCQCLRCEKGNQASAAPNYQASSILSLLSSSPPAVAILDAVLDTGAPPETLGWLTRTLGSPCPPILRSPVSIFSPASDSHLGLVDLVRWSQSTVYTLSRNSVVAKPNAYDAILSRIHTLNQQTRTQGTEGPVFCRAFLKLAAQRQAVCLERGDWDGAAWAGQVVLVGYLLVYPPRHPLVSLHCLTVAKLLWNAGTESSSELTYASWLISAALRGLFLTHPKDSYVIHDAQQLLEFIHHELGGRKAVKGH